MSHRKPTDLVFCAAQNFGTAFSKLNLRNLLDNASKYTPEGGMIKLSMHTEGDFMVLTMVDDGIGITAETLPNIFEPFVQDARNGL